MRDFGLARALQAVMHLDMVGYTQLIAADDIGTIKRWDAIRQHVIEPAVSAHGGRVAKPLVIRC